MEGRSASGRRWDLTLLVGGCLGIAALGVVVGLLLPTLRTPGNAMAEEEQASLTPAPINGERAFGYLKQICDLGPRPAGTPANAKQRALAAEHFKQLKAEVREQPFRGRDPRTGRPVDMVNLIASWFPDRTERVLIAAHYDTRPYPDRDPDPIRRQGAFIGANDCASGVALLMELAHHLDESSTPWGVDLVMLDGEELVYGEAGEYFLGSKAFGAAYRAERRKGKSKSKYVAGILLDMVGGRDLQLPKEAYSMDLAPQLVRAVWRVAQRVDAPAFLDRGGDRVMDDHLALNDAGIPTIDIIDFHYHAWHTADDTPEQCSGASLAQVGKVLTAWLSLPKPRGRR